MRIHLHFNILGIPIRGSTFVRQNSEESQQRSISPNEQSRVRVSGFGVTPQTNPRHQRTLSMSSTHTPTLNTIHEPVQPPLQKNVRVRHPSLQIAGKYIADVTFEIIFGIHCWIW